MFGMMEALLSFIRRQVGLRTDAASATGSLHAKIKDIADNKIGTSDDDRADNTMLGWLNTPIKSWQRVTFTPNADAYGVTITSVNPSKCLVVINGSGLATYASGETSGTGAMDYYVSGFTSTALTVARSWTVASTVLQRGTLSAIIVELY